MFDFNTHTYVNLPVGISTHSPCKGMIVMLLDARRFNAFHYAEFEVEEYKVVIHKGVIYVSRAGDILDNAAALNVIIDFIDILPIRISDSNDVKHTMAIDSSKLEEFIKASNEVVVLEQERLLEIQANRGAVLSAMKMKS